MKVEVVLYRAADMTAISTYGTEAPTWQDCVRDILSWLRIEVLPYWEKNTLRLSSCAENDDRAAAAIYGIGLSYYMVEQVTHI